MTAVFACMAALISAWLASDDADVGPTPYIGQHVIASGNQVYCYRTDVISSKCKRCTGYL